MFVSDDAVRRFLILAKNASEMSDFPRQKLGAVLVHKNRVISVGWNCLKENPLQKFYNKYRGYDVETVKNSLHAEMLCILRAKDLDISWNKTSIFVYRAYKNGHTALAKPCAACTRAIKDLGIKNVYYTTDTESGWVHEHWN